MEIPLIKPASINLEEEKRKNLEIFFRIKFVSIMIFSTMKSIAFFTLLFFMAYEIKSALGIDLIPEWSLFH